MANTILFKRGPKATLPVGLAGEPLYAVDSKEVFVGDGVSNLALVSTDGTQPLTNKTIDADLNTISNIDDGNIKANAGIDVSKLADGSVSNTEFQYINGLTSDAQTQITTNATNLSNHISSLTAHTAANLVNVPTGNLSATNLQSAVDELQTDIDGRIPSTEKGAALGVATLDGGGKVPATQLPNSVMELQGFWDASTNTPTLIDGVGNPGDVYSVSVAGTQDLGSGNLTFAIGDFVIYAGDNKWHLSLNSNAVTSVNGYTGTVILTKSDVGLSNVDNTSDANKPVSTAQATAINAVQTNLDNHINDVLGAHTASAINTNSVAFTGILTATEDDVQKSLEKLSSSATVKVNEDIPLTQFNISNNQAVMTDVTGFLFNPATVRSFEALVSVYVDATGKLYESFKIQGLNKDTGWVTAIDSIGDNSTIWFDVTNAGQVQYTSGNIPGFVSGKMSFRAIITKI